MTVGIYARYSSALQNERSLEDQIALCTTYTERHGCVVTAVEGDAEKSGTTIVGRSGYHRIVAQAEEGVFQVLLVEAQDRLSRNQRDTHELIETLESLDILLCTVQDGIIDDVRATINALYAAQFIKGHAQKVRRGQAGAARRGSVHGVAYGYKLIRTTEHPSGAREIDPLTAPIIRGIFEDYAAGVSTNTICAELNNRGIPSPKGKLWRAPSLTGCKKLSGGMLRNEIYNGTSTWGSTRNKRNSRTGTVATLPGRPEEKESCPKPDLAIVSKELWDVVQARLEESGRGKLGTRKKAVYLFSGRLTCGECGHSYAIAGEGRLYCTAHLVSDNCNNRRGVDREPLERAVLAGISDQVFRSDLIEQCIREYRSERASVSRDAQADAALSAAKIPKLRLAIDRITDQIIEGQGEGSGIAGALLRQRLEVLGAELKKAERDASTSMADQDLSGSDEQVVARLKVTFQGLQQALYGPERDAARARELLRAMIDRIVITPVGLGEAGSDGRGNGPIRIRVDGRLSELLGLADINIGHQVLTRKSALASHNSMKLAFTIWTEILNKDKRMSLDISGVEDYLIRSAAPVQLESLKAAMERGEIDIPKCRKPRTNDSLLRSALASLKAEGIIRGVRVGTRHMWVSNRHRISDEEWIRRARSDVVPALPPYATAPTAQILIIGPADHLPISRATVAHA